MPLDPAGLLNAVKAKLLASGRYVAVDFGDPPDPPNGVSAYIIVDRIAVDETTLSSGSGPITLVVRLFRNIASGSPAEVDIDMARHVLDFWEDVAGDFDLGDANVRAVMPMYEADFVYRQVNSTVWFRSVDLRIDIYVNDIVAHIK